MIGTTSFGSQFGFSKIVIYKKPSSETRHLIERGRKIPKIDLSEAKTLLENKKTRATTAEVVARLNYLCYLSVR